MQRPLRVWATAAVLLLAAACHTSAQTVALKIVDTNALPVRRPKPFAPFRGFKDAVRYGANYTLFGALDVHVTHKPIPKLTSEMMHWWFQNIEGYTKDPRDNVTYPRYLLFHPLDHVVHKATPRPFRTGTTNLVWIEFPMVRCKFFPWNGNKYTPWTCPPDRKGFLRGDSPSLWAREHQTNVSMRLLRFNRNHISFALMVDAGSGPQVPGIMTNHWWSDTPQGLQFRSQQLVGINNPIGQLRLARLNNRTINEQILQGYAADYSEFDSAYMQILHFLEEYGHLEHFLPWVYAAAPKPPPPPPPPPRRTRPPRSSPAKTAAAPAPGKPAAAPAPSTSRGATSSTPSRPANPPRPADSPRPARSPRPDSSPRPPRSSPAVVPALAGTTPQVKPKPVKKDDDKKSQDKPKEVKKDKDDKKGKDSKKDKDDGKDKRKDL